MGVEPIGEDALSGRTELSRAGQHAAAVDPYRKVESHAVFERQHFRGQLGRAVKRDRRRWSKSLGHAASVMPAGSGAGIIQPEAPRTRSQGQSRQRGNRIDAAGAQQHEARPVRLQYSSNSRCRQVVFDHWRLLGCPTAPRQHARVGGGVDHPVTRRELSKSLAACARRHG